MSAADRLRRCGLRTPMFDWLLALEAILALMALPMGLALRGPAGTKVFIAETFVAV